MSINLINYALAKKDWKKAYEDLKVLEIGGRNYVRDSLFQKGNEFWLFNAAGTTEFVDGAFRGYPAVRRAVNETVNVWAGIVSLANGIEVSSGDKVTASVWYKVESDADALEIEVEYFPNPDRRGGRLGARQLRLENTVGDWKYAKATFATDNFEGYDKVYAFFRIWVLQKGTVLYALPKLEKGNRASDWTPAPEDINAHPFVAELAETVYRSKQNEERIQNLENAITALGGGS